MKKEQHNPFLEIERKTFKKRYLQRLIEEQEAQKEIVFYKDKKDEDCSDESGTDRQDGERFDNCQRGQGKLS